MKPKSLTEAVAIALSGVHGDIDECDALDFYRDEARAAIKAVRDFKRRKKC